MKIQESITTDETYLADFPLSKSKDGVNVWN